jgi:hypothetical protein
MKLKSLHPQKHFLKFLSLAILVLGASVGVILATQKSTVFDESEARICECDQYNGCGVNYHCSNQTCGTCVSNTNPIPNKTSNPAPSGGTKPKYKCGDTAFCSSLNRNCPYGCPSQEIYGQLIPICQCGWGTKPTPVGCHDTDSYSCSGRCPNGTTCDRGDASDPCSCLY